MAARSARCRFSGLAACLFVFTCGAYAQNFPERPIRRTPRGHFPPGYRPGGSRSTRYSRNTLPDGQLKSISTTTADSLMGRVEVTLM